MKKTILEIYSLAVCFVMMVCLMVVLCLAGYGSLEIVNPEFTINSWQYARHQNNDTYWKNCNDLSFCPPSTRVDKRPPEEMLTKLREESYERLLSGERRNGEKILVNCLIFTLVDMLIFLFHWVVARSARNAARNVVAAAEDAVSQLA